MHWGRGIRYASVREGTVEINSIEPGDHAIFFRPHIGPVPAPTNVRTSRGANEVVWDLPPANARMEGVVVDALSALPLRDVEVTPASEGGSSWRVGFYPQSLTNDDGRFTLTVEDPVQPLFFKREGYGSQVLPANETSTVRLVPGTSARSVKVDP